MTDTFVHKIRAEERSLTQIYWAKKIKEAIRLGMSHKGDISSKNAKIQENIREVIEEMEK